MSDNWSDRFSNQSDQSAYSKHEYMSSFLYKISMYLVIGSFGINAKEPYNHELSVVCRCRPASSTDIGMDPWTVLLATGFIIETSYFTHISTHIHEILGLSCRCG